METTVTEQQSVLNKILKNKKTAWLLIAMSAILMIIDNLLKMPFLIGAWHIVLYVILLAPLVYLLWKKEVLNPYTKWFLPLLGIMIIDMFIYSNDMVQFSLPIIFYILVILLYLSSMQKVHSLYQTFIPRFALPLRGVSYIKDFLDGLVIKRGDKKLYARIGLALLITLPFLGIFVALLSGADSQYSHFITRLFRFNLDFELHYLVTMPLYFIVYLLLFIYGFSNYKIRTEVQDTKVLDLLIVGIFLGMINLLFLSFIVMQVPFLLDSTHIPNNMNIAYFAREGFFQLMAVMGLVMIIFLFIMRRFKGEKSINFFLVGLLMQSIIMGIVSLKKMYLYQEIKGATVLRYYVEWFDYFLILTLALGIVFLARKYTFTKLLNIITILGLVSFTLIVSLNIDAMVAEHNIEKFKDTQKSLDKNAISQLSIDALPIVNKYKIAIDDNWRYSYNGTDSKIYSPWYTQSDRKSCNSFATYHYGYCSLLKEYGN